jgi:hypothetical protein
MSIRTCALKVANIHLLTFLPHGYTTLHQHRPEGVFAKDGGGNTPLHVASCQAPVDAIRVDEEQKTKEKIERNCTDAIQLVVDAWPEGAL